MANERTGQARRFRFWDKLWEQHGLNNSMLKEEESRHLDTVAPDGNLDVMNAEQRMGRVIQLSDMIKRLKLMNPILIFEVSINDKTKMGIYRPWNNPRTKKLEKKLICGMENGPQPEHSIITGEDHEMPVPEAVMARPDVQTIKTFKTERRGWRTVIARLLQDGFIKMNQVENLFPMADGSSAHWQGMINRRKPDASKIFERR